MNDSFIENEKIFCNVLQPNSFDELIGQENLKTKLKIAIQAAQERNEHLPSILLYGPSGHGKSTIAKVIANEFNSKLITIMSPSIKGVPDLLKVLFNIPEKAILFIDECHALSTKCEETLYGVMDNFTITIQTSPTTTINTPIAHCTIIGATTNIGGLTEPLRNRFQIVHELESYSLSELSIITKANIQKLSLNVCDENILNDLAKRCRNNPRLANRLLYRIRDFVQINGKDVIDQESVDYVMDLEEIDKEGLSKLDKAYLNCLYEKFVCVPTGLTSISSSLGQPKDFIEQYVEPFLLEKGFINKTKVGRVLTNKAVEYLK